MRIGVLSLVLFLAVGIAPGTLAASPATAPAASSRPAAPLPRLVFFMNPNGQPCQIQDRILQEMAAELKGKAEVVYYRTTVPGDVARFQQYGIRALPTLMLTDASGREIRRSTPGIQPAPQVRQLVGN